MMLTPMMRAGPPAKGTQEDESDDSVPSDVSVPEGSNAAGLV